MKKEVRVVLFCITVFIFFGVTRLYAASKEEPVKEIMEPKCLAEKTITLSEDDNKVDQEISHFLNETPNEVVILFSKSQTPDQITVKSFQPEDYKRLKLKAGDEVYLIRRNALSKKMEGKLNGKVREFLRVTNVVDIYKLDEIPLEMAPTIQK